MAAKNQKRIFHSVKIIWNEDFSGHKVFFELSGVHSSLHCLLCFHATVALGSCSRACLITKPHVFTTWPFIGKLCWPWSVWEQDEPLSNQAYSWMHGVRFLEVRLGTRRAEDALSNLRASRAEAGQAHPTSTISNRKQTRLTSVWTEMMVSKGDLSTH